MPENDAIRDLIARLKLIVDKGSIDNASKAFNNLENNINNNAKNASKAYEVLYQQLKLIRSEIEAIQRLSRSSAGLGSGSSSLALGSGKGLVALSTSVSVVRQLSAGLSDANGKALALYSTLSKYSSFGGRNQQQPKLLGGLDPNIIEGQFRDVTPSKQLGSGPMQSAAGYNAAAAAATNASQAFQQAAAAEAQAFDVVGQHADYVRQIAEQLGISLEEALNHWQEITSINGRIGYQSSTVARNQVAERLGIPMTGGFGGAGDGGNIPRAANEVSDLNSVLGKNATTTRKANKEWASFSAAFAGFQLRFVGEQINRFGLQILTPIEQYVKYAGAAESESAKWADSQKDIEKSMMRIGRSLIDEALPAIELAAKFVGNIAETLEKNPILAKALVGLAGGSIAIGSLLSLAGTVLTGVAALKYVLPALFGGGGAAAGGATAIGATAATTAAATAGGATATSAIVGILLPVLAVAGVTAAIVGIAILAYKGLAATDFGKSRNMNDAPGQIASMAAGGAGAIYAKITGQDPYKESVKWFYAVGRLTGVVKGLGTAAEKTTGQLGPSEEAVGSYIEYLKSVADVEKQYEKQRTDIIKDYGKQRADLEEQYAADSAKIKNDIAKEQQSITDDDKDARKQQLDRLAEFQKSERRAWEDYYNDRSKLARDYGIDIQRAEEDHQREMRNMLIDHNFKVEGLLGEQDAFGILSEMQSYEKERSRAEEEYAVESSRRSEDFTLRMSDMEREFALERARRLEDFSQQQQEAEVQRVEAKKKRLAELVDKQKELDEQHAEDLKKLNEDKAERLAELDKTHAEEKQKMYADYMDKLRMLDASLLNEKQLRNQYYQQMSKDLQSWLASMGGQFATNLPGYPGKALGGYADNGLYNLGEKGYEFVLNHQTTRALENSLSGNLTQDRVMAAMSGGSGSITLNQNFRFHGSLSDSERQWFRNTAYSEAMSGLSSILRDQ
jgi:hypothetical protein